jgi:hypothetical protein
LKNPKNETTDEEKPDDVTGNIDRRRKFMHTTRRGLVRIWGISMNFAFRGG